MLKVRVDLWNFETDDGRSIRKAYEYLLPFALNQKEWEYKEITNLDDAKSEFMEMVKNTASSFKDDAILEIIEKED